MTGYYKVKMVYIVITKDGFCVRDEEGEELIFTTKKEAHYMRKKLEKERMEYRALTSQKRNGR